MATYASASVCSETRPQLKLSFDIPVLHWSTWSLNTISYKLSKNTHYNITFHLLSFATNVTSFSYSWFWFDVFPSIFSPLRPGYFYLQQIIMLFNNAWFTSKAVHRELKRTICYVIRTLVLLYGNNLGIVLVFYLTFKHSHRKWIHFIFVSVSNLFYENTSFDPRIHR